jgi:autotransporter translocation and assembly factor TamB
MKRTLLILLFGIAVFFGIYFYLYSDRLKQHAIAYVIKQVETNTGWHLEVDHVEISLPDDIHIGKLKVFNNTQPLLTVKDLKLSVSLWELFNHRLVFSSIAADQVFVSSTSSAHVPENVEPASLQDPLIPWSSIPAYIEVSSLNISHFFADTTLVNALKLQDFSFFSTTHPSISIKGHFIIDPSDKSVFTDVTLAPGSTEEFTHLNITLHENLGNSNFQLHLTESDNSFIANSFHFPKGYLYQATLHAQGPYEAWNQIIQSRETNDDNLLTGDFQVSYALKQKQIDIQKAADSLPISFGEHGFVKGLFNINTKRAFKGSNIEGLIGSLAFNGTFATNPFHELDGTQFHFKTSDTAFLEKFQVKVAEIAGNCQLSGPFSQPNVALKIYSEKAEIQEQLFEKIAIINDFTYAENAIEGTLALQGEQEKETPYLPKIEFTGATEYRWNFGQNIALSSIEGIIGNTHLYGDLRIVLPSFFVDGNLTGQVDLPLLEKMLGQKIEGTALADLHLSHSVSDTLQHLMLTVKTPLATSGNSTFKNILGKLELTNLWQQPTGSLQLECQNALVGGLSLKNINYQTTVDQNSEWPFSLSFRSQDSDQLAFETKGLWHYADDTFLLTLNKLKNRSEKYPINLKQPFTTTFSPDAFTLTPIAISIATGSISATLDSSAEQTQAIVRLDDIPMELLNLYHLNVSMTGNASAKGTITQDALGVTGNLQLEMSNVKLEDSLPNTMPLQATFSAGLYAGLLQCTGRIVGMGPEPIDLIAELPVSASLSPFTFSIEKDQSFNGHLSMQSPLGPLLEFFSPTSITHLTGRANISLDFLGTLEAPQVKGFANLTDGTCEFLDLGLSLKNIKMQAALDGTQITLSEFYASDGISGTISGKGTATLDASYAFPFDLQFQLNHVSLLNLPSANLIASGKLNLKGNRDGATLQGKIVTDEVKSVIPEQIPSLAQSVEVTYINQDPAKPAPTIYVPKNSSWPVALNFELEMPKGAITGEDWSSEWKGNVAVSGTADAPLFNGTFKIISGDYRFNGKSFEINQGTITLAGDPEKKTSLYVIASREIETYKIEIILKGPMKDPVITFRSNPPLSQREILSWILFNQGLSEITPFQGTELNESITHLNTGTGKSKKPDMLTRLRNQIGIDRFDINREDNGIDGGVSVKVGKYISKGVLVTINKGITNQCNKVAIEAVLIRNFKVQAEVGDDSQGELLLKWKKDY